MVITSVETSAIQIGDTGIFRCRHLFAFVHTTLRDRSLFCWKVTLTLMLNSISFVCKGVTPKPSSTPLFRIEPRFANSLLWQKAERSHHKDKAYRWSSNDNNRQSSTDGYGRNRHLSLHSRYVLLPISGRVGIPDYPHRYRRATSYRYHAIGFHQLQGSYKNRSHSDYRKDRSRHAVSDYSEK